MEPDADDSRACNTCGALMTEGFCIDGGAEYYCSEPCLHVHIPEAEYLALYDDGNGDSYWTTWEN